MISVLGLWYSAQETPIGSGTLLLLATTVLWTIYKVGAK
jgi:hypothetical protein